MYFFTNSCRRSNGTFSITTNGGVQTISLFGKGVSGSVAKITPSSWDAGEINLGEFVVSHSFTLKNDGEGTFTILYARFSSFNWLTWVSTFNPLIALAPGETHEFNITFFPMSIGNINETYEIRTNGGNV